MTRERRKNASAAARSSARETRNKARPVARHAFDATTRLATRVLNGEVVFFVGSGFSVDSERNTAARFVGRLLAGLLAMITALGEEDEASRLSEARTMLDRMARVFELKSAIRPAGAPLDPARCMTQEIITLLAREYLQLQRMVGQRAQRVVR